MAFRLRGYSVQAFEGDKVSSRRAHMNGISCLNLHHCYRVVVEDCRDVFGGKLVGGVADEKTGLPNRTVTNNNTSICSQIELV